MVDTGERDAPTVTALRDRAAAAYAAVVAEPEQAAADIDELVDSARRAGDAVALVRALRAQAWLARSRLEHNRASAILDEAERVARRDELDPEWREVLTTRGAVRHEQGRLRAAARDFERAAARPGGDDDPELDAQRAALLQNRGELTAASDLYRRLLARPHVPASVRTKAANNLGMIEVWCGRPERGLAWFDLAAGHAAEVGPAAAAFVAAGRAWATVRAGRLTEGLALYEDATAQWRAAGLPTAELLAEHADALADLRLIPEAINEARRAIASLQAHGFDLIAAETQLRVARLALDAGDPTEAAAEADRATAQLIGHRRGHWAARARLIGIEARARAGTLTAGDLASARRQARTLTAGGFISDAVDAHLVAGRVAAQLGRHDLARAAWLQAGELARGAPLLTRLRGRLALALAAEQHRELLEHARAGLRDLDRHRAALASPELRALASGHGAELGQLGLRAVAARGRATSVLRWMERTRAAAANLADPPDTTGVEEELGRLRAVQSELAAARREGAASVQALADEQATLEAKIRRAMWIKSRAASETGSQRSPAALRRALGGRTLVEYAELDGRLVAVVLDETTARCVGLGEAAVVIEENDALRFALHRLSRPGASAASIDAARSSAETARTSLAQMVLEPLGLPSLRELVVVPVGALARLPWAALHDGPVAVAPSAEAWARSAARPARGDKVVLVAGPELPGAVAEVAALAEIHPHATVLTPPSTSLAVAGPAIGSGALVHLACHGSVRADNPLFSSLLVSDEAITVQEIERRGWAPHRLVLAACEASTERVYDGNESLGFITTLLAAGTAGLVASSVVIPDRQVTGLMIELHRNLAAGQTMAAALHGARARIDTDDPAAYVGWCSFNAYGAGSPHRAGVRR